MKATPTEVKDDRGVTVGMIMPRVWKFAGETAIEFMTTAYRRHGVQTRTFGTFRSAKNFILTGKTT